MTKKFRFMTGLLAVVLAFVMLSSVAYIAAEAGHDCTGADCAICHQIHVCENLLKSIGLAGFAAAAAALIGRPARCRSEAAAPAPLRGGRIRRAAPAAASHSGAALRRKHSDMRGSCA